MAKRNSSGSSSGRRGASRPTRGNGASSGGRKSGGKPFKKSDKPYGRRDEGSSERGSSSFDSRKRPSSSSPRKPPFRKFDSGDADKAGGRPFKSGKPYGRRDEGSSEGEGRSYGNRKSSFSSGSRKPPYKRSGFDDSDKPRGRSFKSDKPYGRKDEGSSESEGRSYGNRKSSFSSGSRKPPFKRSGSGDSEKPRGRSFKSDKPYGRRDEGSSEGESKSYGERKGSFSSGSRKPPFKKFDSGDSDKPRGRSFKSDKPNGRRDEGSSEGESKSYGERRGSFSSGSRKPPFKKFDSDNADKPGARSFKSGKPFGRKEEGSSAGENKPYGSRAKDKFGKRDDDKPEGFSKKSKRSDSPRTDSRRSQDDSVAPAQTQQIRLNRYIANSGVCSRREADELIAMGLVSVNGKTVSEMGYKVNPGDEVRYENKVLKAEKPVYILLNKPKGYLTTTEDPQERKTVMHLVAGSVKERIYPVGRLDRNTTGLLLLTNDGDLADKLMHPSYNIKKIYKVELDRPLTKADFQTVLDGVVLEEGRVVVDDLAIVSDDGKTVGVEIHIGWNRVVRRIFESLSYEVVRLDRSVYAGLDKKDLGRGEWRFLKKEEIVRLKHFK